MDILTLADMIDFPDHVGWVAEVAGALKATTVALLDREPTKREMEYLLGGYLMGLIEVQEREDESQST